MRKPWTAEAKKNHLEGCRRYQRERKRMKLIAQCDEFDDLMDRIHKKAERENFEPFDFIKVIIELGGRKEKVFLEEEPEGFATQARELTRNLQENRGNIDPVMIVDHLYAIKQGETNC